MKRRQSIIFTLLAFLTLSTLSATQAEAQRYSGRASAIRTTVGIPLVSPITTAVNDTNELPSTGGSIALTSASASIAGAALTAGTTSSETSGGAGASHSETSVANLNFTVLGNLITATTIATETDCSCPSEVCTGSTTIVGLMLNGSAVIIDGTASQTINLFGPLGGIVGTLIINEQIPESPASGSIIVNALHLNVTDSIIGTSTDVVIASSHSDIDCAIAINDNFYSGRAYGIGNVVTNQIVLLGDSSVGLFVADTGPLPAAGGNIGPVTVAGAAIPGVATSGTLTASTSGGFVGPLRVSDSSANVEDLAVTVAGFGITAAVLNSQTHCQCVLGAGGTSSCTGGSQIVRLRITTPLGGTVTGTITGAANETIELRVLGVLVATVIFNEQIPTSPTTGGTITVNALHVRTTETVLNVSTTNTDTIVASSHSDIVCGLLGPSAASVDISGRVMAGSRPINRARVTLSSPTGQSFSAVTNSLGYFTVAGVRAGRTYLVDISAKGRTFETQTLRVNDELTGLIFMME